jgi:hypothetical protein
VSVVGKEVDGTEVDGKPDGESDGMVGEKVDGMPDGNTVGYRLVRRGVGAAVVGTSVWPSAGTTKIAYESMLFHPPPLYTFQGVASSGQSAPPLLVLFTPDTLDA